MAAASFVPLRMAPKLLFKKSLRVDFYACKYWFVNRKIIKNDESFN